MSNYATLHVVANGCITDAALNPIVRGTVSFLTTDAKDSPLPVSVIGSKQSVVQNVTRDIQDGSIVGGSLSLINPNGDQTSPKNFRYRISVTDLDTNKTTVYRNVLIQGDPNGEWGFHNLNAGLAVAAIPVAIVSGIKGDQGVQGVQGLKGDTGSVAGTSIVGTYSSKSRNMFIVQNNLYSDQNSPNADNLNTAQFFDQTQVYGFGHSNGNYAAVPQWSVAKSADLSLTTVRRGINQLVSGTLVTKGIGDKAWMYGYMYAVGAPTAPSDEGWTTISMHSIELVGFYHGTVQSTTGLGDVAPVLNYAVSGDATTFDGGILLNKTKSSALTCTMTGFSQNLENYLNYLPVSVQAGAVNGKLPLMTAFGASGLGLYGSNHQDGYTGNVETRTITLKPINGTTQPFQNGIARLVGQNNTEQVVLTNVQAVSPGAATQTVTIQYRYANNNFYLSQGPLQDRYISFRSRLATAGASSSGPIMSSYVVFGSDDGVRLLYACVHSGAVGHSIPYGDQDGAGACETAGYHKDINGNRPFGVMDLYVGAEVVANTTPPQDSSPHPALEPNRIPWAMGDEVMCPHPPSGGGGFSYWWKHFPQTPIKPGYSAGHTVLEAGGQGVGGYYGFLQILNDNQNSMYHAGGGGIQKPGGITIGQPQDDGVFRYGLSLKSSPDPIAVDGDAYAFGVLYESPSNNGREWRVLRLPHESLTYFQNNTTNNPNGNFGGVDNQHYLRYPFLLSNLMRTGQIYTQEIYVNGKLNLTAGNLFVDAAANVYVHDGSNYRQAVTGDVNYKDSNGNNQTMHFIKGLLVGQN